MIKIEEAYSNAWFNEIEAGQQTLVEKHLGMKIEYAAGFRFDVPDGRTFNT